MKVMRTLVLSNEESLGEYIGFIKNENGKYV